MWGGWGLLTGDVGEGCGLDVEVVCTYWYGVSICLLCCCRLCWLGLFGERGEGLENHTFKDNGIRLEVEKDQTVCERDVESREQNDGFKDKHSDWTGDDLSSAVSKASILQLLPRQIRIAPRLLS